MADIIPFDEVKERVAEKMSLSQLIARAVDLKDDVPEKTSAGMLMTDEQKLEIIFERTISGILLKRKLLAPGFFICSRYIAVLLKRTSSSVPESWFAVDYFIQGVREGRPELIKQGAGLCFLFCSVFPERSNHRNMTFGSYSKLGAGLYYNFYLRTGKDVGRFMSRGFETMTDVTRQCFQSL